MENEQKTIVSDEVVERVDNSADILTPKVIESLQDDPSRCDEPEVSIKADVEDVGTNNVDEQKLTCDVQEAAIERTPNESNSGIGNDIIDQVDHIVEQEEIESIVAQKPDGPNDFEADTSLLVPLVDSTPERTTVESTEFSDIDIASSNTGCDGEQPSDDFDFEAITTDGDIPMECVLESSPEKCSRLGVSENDSVTYNLNSSPLQNVRSRRERSVSLSSTDRDTGSGKPNEIYELTDDDEDDANAGRSDNRSRRQKFSPTNDFDDEIGSDTFDDSSEGDAQSMSDEDEYDSEERIHSIDDSDDDEVTSPHAVRRI